MTEYNTSNIIEMNYEFLVESFLNRKPLQNGPNYRGTYTTGHSLVVCGYEIARFWGNDLQIKYERMISIEIYNLLPNVKITIKYNVSYPEIYLNDVRMNYDSNDWIFVDSKKESQ